MEKQCPNCETNFTPNSGKQKFCSDKCKVAFARKTAKGIEGVKSAKDIPPPPPREPTQAEIEQGNEDIDLLTRLKAFCKQFKTNPDDLFSWLMNNYGKTKKQAKIEDKGAKTTIPNEKSKHSTFWAERMKNKCGI